ncbi:Type I secretion system ATP-binding protein PrsD [Hartmannibacter diazotrophicus]|uniref:Type I secretion system ATP-binding protein PrsD n=1 Tax=Hartmannibacter diazotrophicus TaxID=1482074 RepID=A0A2C9DDV8_9HYPH|nr:type I secretion system permease/ATPase [Hartmannibacter diazotrophicus]SON57805.1 Type I secretion system ATP-binding protein PrsD [Hartmannibacter diazotrophicus]
MKNTPRSAADQLQAAIQAVRKPLCGVSAISSIGNILMLTGPVFMMLIYNKVLTSKSIPTLVALSLLVLVLYVFYGFLEGLRSRLMARVGIAFDHRLAPTLFSATLKLPLQFGPYAREHDPLQDLAAVRNYLMGPGPVTILDLPWVPLYYCLLFAMHPLLGVAAVGGAVFLLIVSFINQRVMRNSSSTANRLHAQTSVLLLDARRNAEAAAAMSMGDDLCKRWGEGYVSSISHARDLADQASLFSAISKTARLTLQSAMLALGALLVIEGELSAGAMLASSIILARALSPIDQIIGHWRATSHSFQAFRRLRMLTARLPKAVAQSHSMPKPHRTLSVRDMVIVPPGTNNATVSGVSFEVEAGDALGIIGPSGAGKSSLIRALVGAWPVARGEVRYDDALISHYSSDAIGNAIGHLPQSIELFDGTIGENIARFRKGATTDQIVEAARLAGVHDMILSFPRGYDTPVGEGGTILSGGQRQRIGLARAVFGNPFVVVLDEPNSNLDPLGEQSLNEAVQRLRQNGQIVIIVAHRPSAIFACNKILSLRKGRAEMFGPKQQVLTALFPRLGQPHKPAPTPESQPAINAPANDARIPSSALKNGTDTVVTSLDQSRVRRQQEASADCAV